MNTGSFASKGNSLQKPAEIAVRGKSGALLSLKRPSPLAAIRMMCTECFGFETHPRECTDKHCPLYTYRGRSTKTMEYAPRVLSEEYKAKAVAGLAKWRASKDKENC